MTRRAFTFAMGAWVACSGLVGPPRAANAQRPISPWRVGVLLALLAPESREVRAFRQGLREAGYASWRRQLGWL
jgi:hypothetical protein